MFVAILGDRRSTLPANWTRETAVAIAAEAELFSDVKVTDQAR